MDLTIRSGVLTHVGQRRKVNEDSVAFFEPTDVNKIKESGYLYVVADGVGGADKGDYASKYASQKVMYEYYQNSGTVPKDRLKSAILLANHDIYQYSFKGNGGKRMATTLVAAVIHDGKCTVANVGDSRAYIIRSNEITQITQDHSVVQQLVNDGLMTPEEAEVSDIRNKITRSIGGKQDLTVDLFEVDLLPGDRILLCSDGLTKYFKNDELLFYVTKGNSKTITPVLVDKANERGGADNISVILVEYDYAEKLAQIPANHDMISRETSPVFYDEITGEEIHPERETNNYVRKPSHKDKTTQEDSAPIIWSKLAVSAFAIFLLFFVFTTGFRYIKGPIPKITPSPENELVVETVEVMANTDTPLSIPTSTITMMPTIEEVIITTEVNAENTAVTAQETQEELRYCRYDVKSGDNFSKIFEIFNFIKTDPNADINQIFKDTCRTTDETGHPCNDAAFIFANYHYFIFDLNDQITADLCESNQGQLTNEGN